MGIVVVIFFVCALTVGIIMIIIGLLTFINYRGLAERRLIKHNAEARIRVAKYPVWFRPIARLHFINKELTLKNYRRTSLLNVLGSIIIVSISLIFLFFIAYNAFFALLPKTVH